MKPSEIIWLLLGTQTFLLVAIAIGVGILVFKNKNRKP